MQSHIPAEGLIKMGMESVVMRTKNGLKKGRELSSETSCISDIFYACAMLSWLNRCLDFQAFL
jgi:hypothetical protein